MEIGFDGAMYVITHVFETIISCFGQTFVDILYMIIGLSAISVFFNLGVSVVRSISHKTSSIDAAYEKNNYKKG